MKNNFILSNWRGNEIDSSEFSAAFEVEDVPRTIKAFIESPFIQKKFYCSNVFRCLLNAMDIAEIEDKKRLESIKFQNKNLDQLIEYHLKKIFSILEESKCVVRLGSYKNVKIEEPTTKEAKERIIDSIDRTNITTYDYVDKTRIDIPDNFMSIDEFKILIKKNRSTDRYYAKNPYVEALIHYEGGWMSQDDLLELSVFIKLFTMEFPHLIHEFNNATVTFSRKGAGDAEGAYSYKFTFSGVPIMYVMAWYDSDEWGAVLQSITKKANIHSHPTPF